MVLWQLLGRFSFLLATDHWGSFSSSQLSRVSELLKTIRDVSSVIVVEGLIVETDWLRSFFHSF